MAENYFYKESLNISAHIDKQGLNIPVLGELSYVMCPAIDEVNISITNKYTTENPKTLTFPFKGFSVVSNQNNTSIDMVSAFIPEIDDEATIKFIIKDKAQREIIINTQTTYQKAGDLSFSGDISSSSSSIKPYSNSEGITITSPSLQVPSGSKNITLVYNFKIGSTIQKIGERYWSPNGNTTYSISSNDVNANLVSLLKNYLNFSDTEAVNDVYNVILEVQAQDGFSIITLSTIIVADFIEAPVLSGDLQLKRGNSTLDNNSNLSMRMFNQGESVRLSFGDITKEDSNKDITTYEIFLGTTDSSTNISDFVYSRLTSVKSTSDNFNYTIGYLNRNQNYKFKIRAIDSKGNYSNEIISQTYIIGCRTTTPKFAISNISTASQGNGTLVSFNFTLNDLGGSSSGIWDPSFYRTYQNFNRAGYDSGRSLTLKVDIGTNGQSLNHSGNYSVDSTSNYLEFNPTSILVSGIEKTDIMYACFTLTISYGQENKQVQAVSQVYIIGNIPTVSYRQNQLGINTKEIPSDAILTIDAVTGKDKIFIRSLTNNKKIEINLNTGNVKGLWLSDPTISEGTFSFPTLSNVYINEGTIKGVTIKDARFEGLSLALKEETIENLKLTSPTVNGGTIEGVTIKDSTIEDLASVLEGETIENLKLTSSMMSGGEIRGTEDKYVLVECALINMATIQNATLLPSTIFDNVNINCGSWDD